MSQKLSIRIIDSDGTTVARRSRKCIDDMEMRGLGRWRGSAFELYEASHRVHLTGRDLLSDGAGMASIDAIKHLPVAGPVIRALTGERPPADWLVEMQPNHIISVRRLEDIDLGPHSRQGFAA